MDRLDKGKVIFCALWMNRELDDIAIVYEVIEYAFAGWDAHDLEGRSRDRIYITFRVVDELTSGRLLVGDACPSSRDISLSL